MPNAFFTSSPGLKNHDFHLSFSIETTFMQKIMPDKVAVTPLVTIKGVSWIYELYINPNVVPTKSIENVTIERSFVDLVLIVL